MSDSQWSIAVIVIVVAAALLVGNAVFLFRAKRKSKRHRMESRHNLSAIIKRAEGSQSPASSSSSNPWQPNREAVSPTKESNPMAPPLPPDITQPEALFLGMTQLGPKQAAASIGKSHDCDD